MFYLGSTLLRLLMVVLAGLFYSQNTHARLQPNIVFILSDDEDLKSHAFMPKTKILLQDKGTIFENYFVTASLCCPSRASTLRGQYPHNTKVQGNLLPEGGFAKFRAMGLERSNIATWLHDAGYHTAFFGKFMNGYRANVHGVLPGWDEWYDSGNGFHNYNYTLNENGRLVAYDSGSQDYLTDVLARKAVSVIKRASASRQPFFLYIAPFTPHTPATWVPQYGRLFTQAELPRMPSFNEVNVSDKPAYVRAQPLLGPKSVEYIESLYRRRLRSLQSTDDLVQKLVKTLQETGELKHTFIVYTSDNGFRMGEHRLWPGKRTAYEEDIQVPFVVRGPGIPAGRLLKQMVLNIDIAPTLARLAGIKPPEFVDGRSFLPLFDHPRQPWRRSFMVGRLQRDSLPQTERAERFRFEAIRTARWIYVEYSGGERELYNLDKDPYQLENVVQETNPRFVQALSLRLDALSDCNTIECRKLEDFSPILRPEHNLAQKERIMKRKCLKHPLTCSPLGANLAATHALFALTQEDTSSEHRHAY
jgi:N-acetylglucosamine-6-sulfatase